MNVQKAGLFMTREDIHKFLAEHKDIFSKIEDISKGYKMSDFVKVDRASKEHLLKGTCEIHGCIYEERRGSLRTDLGSVEHRLTVEYLDLLCDLIETNDDIDKVLYIVAYHYLSLCKQIAYDLTESNNALFHFYGDEMSPRAKDNYEKYMEICGTEFLGLMQWFTKEDLLYYRTIYCECCNHHHAVKNFSLLNCLIDWNYKVSHYWLDSMFQQMLDLFIFRYKAIYSVERIGYYMSPDTKKKIVSSLTDVF